MPISLSLCSITCNTRSPAYVAASKIGYCLDPLRLLLLCVGAGINAGPGYHTGAKAVRQRIGGTVIVHLQLLGLPVLPGKPQAFPEPVRDGRSLRPIAPTTPEL